MGGYDYQVWRSIESWVMLADEEVLFLEGAEDIDRMSSSETTTVQVKRTEDGVSLNTQNVSHCSSRRKGIPRRSSRRWQPHGA